MCALNYYFALNYSFAILLLINFQKQNTILMHAYLKLGFKKPTLVLRQVFRRIRANLYKKTLLDFNEFDEPCLEMTESASKWDSAM